MSHSLRILESGSHLSPIRDAAREAKFSVGADENWDILWSFRTPWDAPLYKARVKKNWSRPPTLVNHLPGTLKLASKAHLPKFVREAGLANDTPVSYLLPEQLDELTSALSQSPLTDPAGLPLWLLKSKQHRGVRVLVNRSRAGLAAQAPAIVQRRVRPLILKGLGRMFDIGLYVLVSQIKPLRVYAFDRALVRVCDLPFPRSHAEFVATPGSYVIKHYSPVWTLPFFRASLKACDRSASCALKRKLRAQGHDADALWRRMEGVAASLLADLRPTVGTAMSRQGLAPGEAFELFRFDFLVDESSRPILTEVNLSPNMVAAHPEDGAVKRSLLTQLMRIVTVRLPPPRPAASLLQSAFGGVGGIRAKLTDYEVLHAEEAIARKGGWYAIDPWARCNGHKCFRTPVDDGPGNATTRG